MSAASGHIDNRQRNSLGSFRLNDVLLYAILQFPLSSMMKVYIGPLNQLISAICFAIFVCLLFKGRLSKIEPCLFLYVVYIIAYNCVACRMDFYNKNMLIYLPFLILFYMFCVRNQEYMIGFIFEHKRYIDYILGIWCAIVLISFVFPSSYTYEGETRGFVSFAGTTFLLAPISLYVFALLCIQFQMYRKRIYVVAMIIPSLCILLGTTRTYLVGLLCAWLIFLYLNIKDKNMYFFILVIGVVVFVGIVLVSPIKYKFIDTFSRTELGLDPLEAFTSGRSLFWVYDMEDYFNRNIIQKIFGTNINYLFYLNLPRFHVALWAHNDYIQILSDYGLVGIFVYIYMIKYLFTGTLKGTKTNKWAIFVLIILWAFIAFFNMFYTYFCATLSLPFFLISLKLNEVESKQTCRRKTIIIDFR